MKKYFVITTPSCGKCKIVKGLIADRGFEDKIEMLDYNSPEGKALAGKFGIRSAGTIHNSTDGTHVTIDAVA